MDAAKAEIPALLGGERDRLGFGADKARYTARVAHDIPAFAGDDHVYKNIARERLAGGNHTLAVAELGNLFGRHDDIKDQILHAVVFNRLFEVDNVRISALTVDVWRHLGVPTAGFVPKMSTAFEQSLHIDIYCHL